jgi:LCP family protein required for cell wall assembly
MTGSEYDQRTVQPRSGYGADSGRDNYGANGYRSRSYSSDLFDQVWAAEDDSGDLPRSLGLAILTVFVPGIGHAAAGYKRTGRVLLTAWLLLIATAVMAFVFLGMDELRALALDTRVLQAVAYGSAVLAVAWSLAVISAYAVNRPRHLSAVQRVGAGLVVFLLGALVATPLAVTAVYANTARDLIISQGGETTGKISGREKLDYFKDRPRINVLLLGGDWTDHREGIRTDSMMVASIDTRTGQTLMISLPRNLYKAPFPAGTPAAAQFPDGFQCPPGTAEINCYLNGLYRYGEEHNTLVPAGTKHPGAALLKQSISEIIGQPVDYFAMVNLDGFQDIVNALGGVRLRVTARIPIGGEVEQDGTVIPPHGYIEPKLYEHMTGRQAMWYARSRFGQDDYARMIRQRCVLGAIARQADPQTVLTKFTSLARATKNVVMMDIPSAAFPALIDLASSGKSAKITGVSVDRDIFISNSDPDYVAIRIKAASWIRKAEAQAERTLAQATATPTASPSGTPAAKPKPPKSAATPGQANSIESTCRYN